MDSKTIFVTGGTGKLGSQFVRQLTSAGHTVITTSRSQANIDALAASLEASDRFYGFELDLEAPDAGDQILAFLQKHQLEVQALVHNARSLEYLKIGANGVVAPGDFLGEMRMDVVIPYSLTMQLVQLPTSKLETVIFIASMYGMVGPNRNLYTDLDQQSAVHYGVGKAAQIQLTKELAVRLAAHNIRVNAISYGGFGGRAPEEFVDRYAKLNPQGRMLEDSEAPGPLAFLISDAARGMTGHNLVYDSGWTAW